MFLYNFTLLIVVLYVYDYHVYGREVFVCTKYWNWNMCIIINYYLQLLVIDRHFFSKTEANVPEVAIEEISLIKFVLLKEPLMNIMSTWEYDAHVWYLPILRYATKYWNCSLYIVIA